MSTGFDIFYFIEGNHTQYYYISINCGRKRHFLNTDIAELLSMNYLDYIELIYSYNSLGSYTTLFLNKDDAQKLADYLNEKYLIILKLEGKI